MNQPTFTVEELGLLKQCLDHHMSRGQIIEMLEADVDNVPELFQAENLALIKSLRQITDGELAALDFSSALLAEDFEPGPDGCEGAAY